MNESGVGKFGLGERNERGDLLANFCQANDMVITNTLFKHTPTQKRLDLFRNQIDFILIDRNSGELQFWTQNQENQE